MLMREAVSGLRRGGGGAARFGRCAAPSTGPTPRASAVRSGDSVPES